MKHLNASLMSDWEIEGPTFEKLSHSAHTVVANALYHKNAKPVCTQTINITCGPMQQAEERFQLQVNKS